MCHSTQSAAALKGVAIPRELLSHVDRAARNNPATLAAIAKAWPRFSAAFDALADAEDDGVPIDCFTDLWQPLAQLVACGVKFGRDFLARVEHLHQQIRSTDEDSDFDEADESIDRDDLDDDSGDEDAISPDITTAGNAGNCITSDRALEELIEQRRQRHNWASGDPTAAARAKHIEGITAAGVGVHLTDFCFVYSSRASPSHA